MVVAVVGQRRVWRPVTPFGVAGFATRSGEGGAANRAGGNLRKAGTGQQGARCGATRVFYTYLLKAAARVFHSVPQHASPSMPRASSGGLRCHIPDFRPVSLVRLALASRRPCFLGFAPARRPCPWRLSRGLGPRGARPACCCLLGAAAPYVAAPAARHGPVNLAPREITCL